jgi:nicotinamidase-related amidase
MHFLSKADLEKNLAKWCSDLGVRQDAKVHFTKPALLVIDMQTDALTEDGKYPVWGGQAIVPRIARLIKAFRARNFPIIYTQYILLEPCGCQQTYDLKNSGRLLRQGSQGSEIHEDLMLLENSYVIAQSRYTAFYDTQLDTLLRVNEVTDVVITGVESNTCCEATAHDAFFRRYRVIFTIDGTGGTDESFHLASLRNFYRAYGKLATVEQIETSLLRSIRPELGVA